MVRASACLALQVSRAEGARDEDTLTGHDEALDGTPDGVELPFFDDNGFSISTRGPRPRAHSRGTDRRLTGSIVVPSVTADPRTISMRISAGVSLTLTVNPAADVQACTVLAGDIGGTRSPLILTGRSS